MFYKIYVFFKIFSTVWLPVTLAEVVAKMDATLLGAVNECIPI